MKLVIVESPTKAKEIAHFLGDGWVVRASFGHVSDLPDKELGVAPPDFRPAYVVSPRASKTIAELKRLAASSSEVYIATDPDREGEAIAFHLVGLLGVGERYHRITYPEISARAVRAAIASPRKIDFGMVRAQEGRRVLDRLVGYRVSPALSNASGARGLSAGRVQSPAVRLVVDREREIRNFVPTDHFGVRLDFVTAGQPWSAVWDHAPLRQPDAPPYWLDRPFAERVATLRDAVVDSVERKEQTRRPPPPFISSTLQQAASNALGLAPKKTMQLAQALFEHGAPDGGGLITYMRTDQPNLSDEAIAAARAWLSTHDFAAMLPEQPNRWRAKAAAQEAHEAIRPLHFDIERIDPHQLVNLKSPTDQKLAAQLYRLIWERAVACQMAPARYDVTEVRLHSAELLDGQPMQFTAEGRVQRFAGWLALTATDHAEEQEQDADQALPELTHGQALTATAGNVTDHRTKPPTRYTEASLIKALDARGIGRPSTYASIMERIGKQQYVLPEGKRKKKPPFLVPTPRGEAIIDMMVGVFGFMEFDYTANMEAQLDEIARGRGDYAALATTVWNDLDHQIPNIRTVRLAVEDGGVETLEETCPECGNPLTRRQGQYGPFISCSGYPECRYHRKDGDTQEVKLFDGHACPECNNPLAIRDGKSGKFLSCTGYPKCEHSEPYISEDDKANPCPSGCGGFLQRRKGKSGWFWGCSNYPSCRETRPDQKGKPGEPVVPKKRGPYKKRGEANSN